MPKIINLRDTNGVLPDGAVLVDRRTKWGNPFRIGVLHQGRILDRQGVLECYFDWLMYSVEGAKLREGITELEGKDLACWCKPEPCHADILLDVASKELT